MCCQPFFFFQIWMFPKSTLVKTSTTTRLFWILKKMNQRSLCFEEEGVFDCCTICLFFRTNLYSKRWRRNERGLGPQIKNWILVLWVLKGAKATASFATWMAQPHAIFSRHFIFFRYGKFSVRPWKLAYDSYERERGAITKKKNDVDIISKNLDFGFSYLCINKRIQRKNNSLSVDG